MISKELLEKVIKFPCGHRRKTLQEMLEDFENSGMAEFWYKGKTYYVWRETDKNGNYLPAIGENNWGGSESWRYFDTWEDLAEKYQFPDGKVMIDFIFDEE